MEKKLKIPLLDLKQEYAFLKKDIDCQIKECLESQGWILGEKVSQFEKETAGYLGVNYVTGVASGTDALLISLRALAINLKNKDFFSKEDEIITTPFTFVATAETIIRAGATPVFVDIDPDTFNIDPKEIKKAINKNTVGIVPVHLYGLSCDMDEIMKMAKENNLFVVEDVAQAFGAGYKEGAGYKKLGTIGDCGAFSSFPSKNLGGYGDGGFIATNNPKTAELIKILRNHGQVKKYNADYIGYNSRLDSIQAAILLAKLKHIDKFNELRRKVADRYRTLLKGIKEIEVPIEPVNSYHVYHLYSVKVPALARDKFLNHLNSNGIESRVYYPVSLCEMKAFKNAKIKSDFKHLKEVLTRIMSMPIHPFLKEKEVNQVAEIASSFSFKV